MVAHCGCVRNIDEARKGFCAAQANFQRLSGADLILDTTIYGAHTGAVDALYAGKPLLTCIGTISSRPAHSETVHFASAHVIVTVLGDWYDRLLTEDDPPSQRDHMMNQRPRQKPLL